MAQLYTCLMSGRPSGRPTFAIGMHTMPLPEFTREVAMSIERDLLAMTCLTRDQRYRENGSFAVPGAGAGVGSESDE